MWMPTIEDLRMSEIFYKKHIENIKCDDSRISKLVARLKYMDAMREYHKEEDKYMDTEHKFYDWYEIIKEWNDIISSSGTPTNVRKFKEGEIIDENKTVVWNREEVKRRNKEYDELIEKIYAEGQEKTRALLEKIYSNIQHEVGYGLTRDSASYIYITAANLSDNSCFEETINTVKSLICLVTSIYSRERKS